MASWVSLMKASFIEALIHQVRSYDLKDFSLQSPVTLQIS